MKEVLIISWKFYNTGGDWTYCLNVTKEYLSRGFKVTVLTSGDEHEELGQEYTYLTKPLVKSSAQMTIWEKAKLAVRFLKQNQLKPGQKKELFSKDWYFVHVHSLVGGVGYYALSSLKKRVPVLYTLHDYHLLCPTSNGYRHGVNCLDCASRSSLAVIKNNCRQNLAESVLMWLQRSTMASRFIKSRVDYFLCPSKFMHKSMLDHGYPAEKLRNNGYCLDKSTHEEFSFDEKIIDNDSLFFAGRLAEYKGIQLLLELCAENGVKIRIAGDGALRDLVENAAERSASVSYLGQLGKEDLRNEILACRAVCVPSLWNENYPFAVTEALLLGKAVLGSQRGGIPELIIEGKNGFVFDPEVKESFKTVIRKLWTEGLAWGPDEIRADIIKRFDSKIHVDEIEDLVNNQS